MGTSPSMPQHNSEMVSRFHIKEHRCLHLFLLIFLIMKYHRLIENIDDSIMNTRYTDHLV